MSDHDPAAYGRRAAATYEDASRWLPTEDAVDALDRLAEGGPVLELGIGSGRLALPLVERGLHVAGIDSSPEMLALLASKPHGRDVVTVLGDFGTSKVEGGFSLVVLAYNTVFALPDQDAQVACFRNAAAHLRPGGRFVVEAWVPDLGSYRDNRGVRVVTLDADEVQLEVSTLHDADQRIDSVKVRLSDGDVRLVPANHRYAFPAELDLMARIAGLRLEQRWSDWLGSPFDDGSRDHVSVYRLDDAPAGGVA